MMILLSSADRDDKKTSDQEKTQAGKESSISRRNLLSTALAVAAALVLAGIAAAAKSLVSPQLPEQTTTSQPAGSTSTSSSQFPRVKVANVSGLEIGKWISFNYPLEETPNILVKLGQKAQGGVGPDGDIVAFSQICQHLGCVYGYVAAGASPSCDATYKASEPVGYCCCHGSVFDLTNGAKVIAGPAPRSQPQVILEFDGTSGDIFATGMTPPTIFGHNTGSNDVSNDLQGGTPVTS